MRDILFRGKRLDNGEWVEGWLYKRVVHLDGCHMNVVVDAIEVYDGKSPLSIAYYTVDPATVGQFTGLTDKNGKKIFEGDIVQYYGTYPLMVCIEEGHTKVRWFDTVTNSECVDMFFGYDEEAYGDVEVIGNSHDNPELPETT